VDVEHLAQQRERVRAGVSQVQPKQRVRLQGALDGRAGDLGFDAVGEQ
jgi:hypothetical protein